MYFGSSYLLLKNCITNGVTDDIEKKKKFENLNSAFKWLIKQIFFYCDNFMMYEDEPGGVKLDIDNLTEEFYRENFMEKYFDINYKEFCEIIKDTEKIKEYIEKTLFEKNKKDDDTTVNKSVDCRKDIINIIFENEEFLLKLIIF